MRKQCTYISTILIWFCLSAPALSANAIEYVESYEHGHINWSTGEVQAIGVGVPYEKDASTSPDANAKMLSIARNTAKKNLFDLLQNVGIESHHQISRRVADNRQMMVQLKEMVYLLVHLLVA